MSKTLGSPEVLANDMSPTSARETGQFSIFSSSGGDCGDQLAISIQLDGGWRWERNAYGGL
jgi:hypothetical protein